MVSTKPKEKKMKEKKKGDINFNLLPVCVYTLEISNEEEGGRDNGVATNNAPAKRDGVLSIAQVFLTRRRLLCRRKKALPFSSMTMVLAKEISVSNPIDVVGYLPDWRLNADDDATRRRTRSLVHALCARTNALILFRSKWTKTES